MCFLTFSDNRAFINFRHSRQYLPVWGYFKNNAFFVCISYEEIQLGEAWGSGGRGNCSQDIVYERRILKSNLEYEFYEI